MLIPALETACIGMAAGDNSTVAIAAADAYGPHQPEAVQKVERSAMPPEMDLQVGMQLQATDPNGQSHILTIIEFDDTNVTLDGNHPLTGQDLTFEIELVEIVASAL